MSKYVMRYTGRKIASWKYEGREYEARMYDDDFGYILEYKNGYLLLVGDSGYDYFLGNDWLHLARKLNVHK